MMKIGLPEFYPSTVELPFNNASLEGRFQVAAPDQDPGTEGFWLLLQGQNILVEHTVKGLQLPTGVSPPITSKFPPLYIGNWDNHPCRLLIATKDVAIPEQFRSESIMAADPQLPLAMLSLAGVGQMIHHWECSSCNCGYCGGLLQHLEGEWGKQCLTCNKLHYPRVHPCVIGLVIKGDEILLARKAEWIDGRYGLVAGFVEFGESLEEAMAREILEETNIKVKNIRYLGSQCWPFPSQLMCGFVADYADGEISLQEDELDDGGWFKLDQLPTIPPRRSIARYLIDQASTFIPEA